MIISYVCVAIKDDDDEHQKDDDIGASSLAACAYRSVKQRENKRNKDNSSVARYSINQPSKQATLY